MFFCNRQPKPCGVAAVGSIQDGKERIAASFRFFEYPAESVGVQQAAGPAKALVDRRAVLGCLAARFRSSLLFAIDPVYLVKASVAHDLWRDAV